MRRGCQYLPRVSNDTLIPRQRSWKRLLLAVAIDDGIWWWDAWCKMRLEISEVGAALVCGARRLKSGQNVADCR